MAFSNAKSESDSRTTSPGVRYLDTTAAYDLWSEVYDSDGNFLQALDIIEMKTLFPRFLSEIPPSPSWKMVDLGCGTGRNTSALLQISGAEVVGLDASPKMLEIAKRRLVVSSSNSGVSNHVRFEIYNLLGTAPPPFVAMEADGLVSTLVLEHIPIPEFFSAIAKMLKKKGVLLVTNMHSDMGQISQAGFVNPQSGEKIRPKSYAHTIDSVLAEARSQGFELVGDVLERSVDEQKSEELGPRAKKWVGVTAWFGLIFRKTI